MDTMVWSRLKTPSNHYCPLYSAQFCAGPVEDIEGKTHSVEGQVILAAGGSGDANSDNSVRMFDVRSKKVIFNQAFIC